tara:strand:- start:1395 stop:1532 length:138 start_codon:yes stop_codon:yes gene_type:complete
MEDLEKLMDKAIKDLEVLRSSLVCERCESTKEIEIICMNCLEELR